MLTASKYKSILSLADDKILLEFREINKGLIANFEKMMFEADDIEQRNLISELCGIFYNNAKIHLPLIEMEIHNRVNPENK